MHNIVIIRPAQKSDRPPKLEIIYPKFGIGQPLGHTMPSLFSPGTQVDRPNQLDLLNRWLADIAIART